MPSIWKTRVGIVVTVPYGRRSLHVLFDDMLYHTYSFHVYQHRYIQYCVLQNDR